MTFQRYKSLEHALGDPKNGEIMNLPSTSTSSPNLSLCGKIPVNQTGVPIFHTSRLCQRLVQPKGGFDLTDPNGYKLPSLYNNLNDPNLKTYMNRRDIHNHLLTNGYITKDDKVICSMKEFNKYRKYLAEVQLDWDHRFRAEQKELVRMLLFMQKEGKLSSDVPITDVMEWILCEGSSAFTLEFRQATDGPERQTGTGDCSCIQLPKIHTQSDFYSSECKHFLSRSEKASRTKGRNILKEVIAEVQREMRLESLKSRASQEEQDKTKQCACKGGTVEKLRRLLEPVAETSGHLTNVRNTILQEEKSRSLTGIDQVARRPTLTKLKPLPKIKRHSGFGDNMTDYVSKDTSIFLPTKITSCPEVSRTQSDLSVLAKCGSEVHKDPTEHSSNHVHATLQHSKREVDHMEGQSKTSVSADCFYSIVGNIVTLVVKEVNGILIPAMQTFESRPAMKKNSTASEKSPPDVLDCEHPVSLSVDQEAASSLCLERFSGEQEDRRRSTSPGSPASELLNPGLIKEAERIIWEVIWKSVNAVIAKRNCTEMTHAETEEAQYRNVGEDNFDNACTLTKSARAALTAEGSIVKFGSQAHITSQVQAMTESSSDSTSLARETSPSENTYLPSVSRIDLLSKELVDDMLERVCSIIAKEKVKVFSAVDDSKASVQSSSRSSTSCSCGPRSSSEALCCVSCGWRQDIQGDGKLLGGHFSSTCPRSRQPSRETSATATYADDMVDGVLRNIEEDAAEYTNDPAKNEHKTTQIPRATQSEKCGSQMSDTASQSPGGSPQLPLESDPRREAAKVSYRVFEKIKENISTVGKGLVQPGKVYKEVEDVLILGIVETALEKLEDITKEEKQIHLNSEKNTVETVPVSVLDSGCKTALYSGHTEVCIELSPQPSNSLLTDSCGSQADIVSDKVVANDACEVQRSSNQERSYNSTEQAEAVSNARHVFEDILRVLRAQGTPIVQYEPRTFDRVSSSLSQAMFKHTSKTALDTQSNQHPRWLAPDASPVSRAFTADSSRGTTTVKAQGPHRGTRPKVKKECRSRSTTLTSDVSPTPSPRIPLGVTVGQRVDAEVSSPATGDGRERDRRGLGGFVSEPPHTRDHFSSRAQASEKVAHDRSICKGDSEQKLSAASMLLLRSTVEKLVNKWMDHFSVADLFLSASEEMERQGSRLCDLFQTSGGQTEKVTGSREVASPHLCNLVTQSVMGSLQLGHSPHASTKNAVDVGPIMWPACSLKPDPPWSGSAPGNPSGEPAPLVKAPVQTEHCHHNTMDQGLSVLTPLESSAQEEPDTACQKPAWFYVIEAQPEPGQETSAPESLCTCLEYLHSLPIEVLEDIVSSLIVNIYSDGGDLHTSLSSPTLSDTAVDLIDDVLNELKISPNHMLVCGDLVMPECAPSEVAQSVHRELLSYSGSHESLRQAVSTSKDHMVKKIASSISLEVSKVAGRIGAVNLDDAPPSPPPGGDADASLVSCPALDLSEDIVLRVLDIVPFSQSPEAKWIGLQGSTDMRRDLLGAVMLELSTSPPILTLSVRAARRWRQTSPEELDGAARRTYQTMVDQCGSEEALESALRLRTKLVNAALANTVANEVFQLFSDEEFYSTHDRATHMEDCNVTDQRSSYTRRGVCPVNCKAMWEMVYRLLQESCPNMLMEAQLIRYSLECFYGALDRLSGCAELKVCWDETACDACRDPWAADFIASRVRQRGKERMGSEVRLGPALEPRDKAVVQCVVDLVAEETLLFMSHHHDISIPAAVLMAKDDTPPPGKEDGDSDEFTRKGLLSAIKGFFGFHKTVTPSPVDCVVQFRRRGHHILSGKIQKRSRRGRFITLEERRRRLAEQMRTCDSRMSDKSDTGFPSEQQPDRHLRGRFGWVLSKLMCAEDIYSMDRL